MINFINTPANNVSQAQNIVFHASLRLDEGVTVLNSLDGGKWQSENRYSTNHILAWNKHFEIVIRVLPNGYEVQLDRHPIGIFYHRHPMNLVKFIRIYGKVEIQHFSIGNDITGPINQGSGFWY
jgi:hypothetical protein